MHQISVIEIENFRSIKKAEFSLSAATALVGYNNAGKTNLLRAINWLISKSRLGASDFWNSTEPITVTATVTGINEEVLAAIGATHRGKIEPLVQDNALTIRRVQNGPNDATKDIKLSVRSIDEGGEETWGNPAGIDGAISHLFPEPVFVGAMENATEDVGKFASGTTIGKLIKEIIEPVRNAHAANLSHALAGLSNALSAEGDEKDASLCDIDARIEQELAGLFPGLSAKTHIPTPEIDDLFKSATIKLFEADGTGRDAASLGHGAQRSVQLALLKTLARIRHEAAAIVGRTTLLLIDEPELYLHPQAVEIIRTSLCTLADDGYQVLFTTHSPLMIARSEAENAILIRRTADQGTFGLSRIKEAVAEAIEAGARQAEILFSLTNSVKFLFAEQVFLAEGLTERTLIPEIFLKETGSSLEEKKSTIVNLESVHNIIPAMRVLAAMGLPCKAIVDVDFIFRGALQYGLLSAEQEELIACKAVLLELAGKSEIALDEAGLPRKGEGKSAAQAFEHFAKQPGAIPHIHKLHTELKDQNVWCWKSGAIEAPLGLTSKKPLAHLNFINSMNDADFEENTPGYGEVAELIEWLNQ